MFFFYYFVKHKFEVNFPLKNIGRIVNDHNHLNFNQT